MNRIRHPDPGRRRLPAGAARRSADRRGASLIGIIAAIVILGLLGAGVLMLMSVGTQESLQAVSRSQAFFAAESGISAARASTNATNTGVVGPASFTAVKDADGKITSVGTKDDTRWTSIWKPAASLGGAMLVYGTRTNIGTPRYRLWLGTNWSGASNALSVGSKYLNWVVVKACPTRDEYIAATIDTGKVVKAQVYSGGSWGNLQTITTNVSSAAYRGVDVAYQSISGEAMVVAANSTTSCTSYVWDGAAWNGPSNVSLARTNIAHWVRLASDPVSDELILMVQDAKSNFTALVWNGSNAWGNPLLCTGRTVNVAYEAMAIEYETSGNQAVIVNNSGVNNSGRFNWSSWNGTNWSAQSTNNALGDYIHFATLVNDPSSDNMLLTYLDNDSDIGKVFWNGSAWTAYYELETSGKSPGDRCVQGLFETMSTNAGHALVPYSDVNSACSRHAATPSGNTWSAEITVSTIGDSATLQTRRTLDGKIMALYFDDANSQYEFSWFNGTNWAAKQTLETEPSVIASPFKEPFMMAPQIYQP